MKLNNNRTVNLQGISNIETRGKGDRSKCKTCEYMGEMSVIMHKKGNRKKDSMLNILDICFGTACGWM